MELERSKDCGIIYRMDRKTISIAVLALAVGALAGYIAASGKGDEQEAPPERTLRHKSRAHVADEGDKASAVALRRRINELEKRLAETAASAAALTNRMPVDAERPERGFGPPNPSEWRARMEDMKVNDPARYAQMTNRMAQWRSRSMANTQDRLDFFASLDTSAMSPRQRENHEKLQNLLVRREELMQMMDFNNPDVSDADRAKARQELHGMWGQINSLEKAERDMLLSQTARNLGCRGAEAKELVDTIKTIYKATQSWGGGHGRR